MESADKRETVTRRVLKQPAQMVWRLQHNEDVQRYFRIDQAQVTVREYAHAKRANRWPNDRVDFAETVYWNAGIRTSPRDGSASVTFDLSDSVTTFRARADAFGDNGALGAGTLDIASVEPFHIEPKMPDEVVMGDRPAVPVALVNATPDELERVGFAVRLEGMGFAPVASPASLPSGSRGRILVELTPEKAGDFSLDLNAAAEGYTDNVSKKITVLPRGFPVQATASGRVGEGKPLFARFVIPEEIVPGSMRTSAKICPTPLANMEEALSALMRRPHGCFEQTSSTNFPLVMAQQYFTNHEGVPAEKIRNTADMLQEGYKRLLLFESKNGGYDWYGEDRGHEALTAYGLMQFMEMRKVMPIDETMLARTRAWLLSRRDGKGGFLRHERSIGSFGRAPEDITNTYILWALLEAGEKPESLSVEIANIKEIVAASEDPYILALGANIFLQIGWTAEARGVADKLRLLQGKDGGLAGERTSITCSRGEALALETTSLAVLAWLRCGDDYWQSVEQAVAWLFERCKDGRFGSTQSTVLALKAINAYDRSRASVKASGSVRLLVDGHPFGPAVAFDEKIMGALELPDFTAALSPGRHTVEVAMTGGGAMPVAIEVSYHSPQPADSPDCPLRLSTALSAVEVAEGEPVDLRVSVSARNEEVSMPLAVIGMPAGLDPRHERLKELVTEGRIASYEIKGRELVLYWRGLAAEEKVELSIPMIARIPGTYTAPASRVYAYYLDEHVQWAAGETIAITPK